LRSIKTTLKIKVKSVLRILNQRKMYSDHKIDNLTFYKLRMFCEELDNTEEL